MKLQLSDSAARRVSDSMIESFESGALRMAATGVMQGRGARLLAESPRKRKRLVQRVVSQIADRLNSDRVTAGMTHEQVRATLTFGWLESWLLSALIKLLVRWAWSLMQMELEADQSGMGMQAP